MNKIVESLYQKYDLNESKQSKSRKRKLNEYVREQWVEPYSNVPRDLWMGAYNLMRDMYDIHEVTPQDIANEMSEYDVEWASTDSYDITYAEAYEAFLTAATNDLFYNYDE